MGCGRLVNNSLRPRCRCIQTQSIRVTAFTSSASPTLNHEHLPSIDPSLPSPPHLLNHAHPPLAPPQSLSDLQISSFYKALMNQPQTTPPQPPATALTPTDLDKLQNPTRLTSESRKQIIPKLSALSHQQHHTQTPSFTILNKIQPWLALLESAASDGDEDDLLEILKHAQDFKHDQTLLLGKTLSTAQEHREPDVARRMQHSCLDAAEKIGLSSSSAAHQVEVYRLLNLTADPPAAAFQAADNYVRKLEKAGKPPDPEVYLQLFDFINYVSMKRITSIDLFNRLRLVAHPNPPISVWNALLRALGSGASTSPERAMDAFLDLKANGLAATVETYNHLIRSMIRARRSAIGTSQRKLGYEKWYFSALRLLKQMIDDDGLTPNLTTFKVLLEGAKRVGDLARAKWTYCLFLQQLQTERSNPLANQQELDWLHVSAAISLFQTYASFKPANKYLQVKKKPGVDRQVFIQASLKDPEFFKTLPQTTQEILNEAELLLAQFIDRKPPHQPHLHVRSSADQRQLSILSCSYLSVYSAHATIDELYSKYTTYTHPIKNNQFHHQSGSIRTSWTYFILLERCEFLRSAEKAGQIGREVFHEWLTESSLLKEFELVKSVESRLTSQIWAAWIRLQAKYGTTKEAMKQLEKFFKTYPPPRPAPEETSSTSLPTPYHRSSATASSQDQADRNNHLDLPYLTFQHLEILHHKLKLVEDSRAIQRLTRIVKRYENSRRTWHELNEVDRLNRIQKGYLQ